MPSSPIPTPRKCYATSPIAIRILMVVDGVPEAFNNISFNHAYFGLGAVLDTLRETAGPGIEYVITRAHRQTDDAEPDPETEPEAWARYGTHFRNFRFDRADFDIDAYDQIWLFGMLGETSAAPEQGGLSDAELDTLARWMDQGGGILAMGDHEDLGAALCQRIPRVRSMRYWKLDETPPVDGENRHDTLQGGHDAIYTFDDESDDVPQPLQLREYASGELSTVHPILVSRRGPITVFPDHPHEGEVVPEDQVVLDGTMVIDGETVDEYPNATRGGPRPETIAWGRVLGNRGDRDINKGPVNPKTFGVLGAYDGHRAGVGRVVVDSTWHHWFDVNLTGRPVEYLDTEPRDETNPKTKGFLVSERGRAIYAQIQTCFRNVGTWLCPAPIQDQLFANQLWTALHRQPLIEGVRASDPLDHIGRRVRAALLTTNDHLALRERLLAGSKAARVGAEAAAEFADAVEVHCLGGITKKMLELHAHGSASLGLAGEGLIDDECLHECVREGTLLGHRACVESMRARVEGLRDAVEALGAEHPSAGG